MDSSAFSGLSGLFRIIAWLLAIFVPLGFWKAVEIAIWLWKHIDIGWVS
jgi:hypothetical protein